MARLLMVVRLGEAK